MRRQFMLCEKGAQHVMGLLTQASHLYRQSCRGRIGVLFYRTPRGPAVRDLPDLIAGLQGGETKMKKASERQSCMVNVRMTDAEALAMSQLAKQLKTNRSRLLRKVIRELIEEGPDLLPNEMKVFEEAVFQLAALGRNFNQLLRLVHSGQVMLSSQEQALMESIRDQVAYLKKQTLIVIDRTRECWVRHAA
jgi:hypothetical protein